MTDVPLTATAGSLNNTFRWMLRRLVRLALNFGITYPTMEALLKHCYLESATHDFALPDKPQTDSRISLLIGLNRSDLRRLRAIPATDERLPTSFEWRVAMRWGEAPYTDGRGARARLPRLARASGDMSFESLVQSISTDIRPAALLAHWVGAGVARVTDGDFVDFDRTRFFNRSGRAAEQTGLLAYTVGDLLQGYIANMPNPEQRRLHVRAHWLERLTPASVEQLDEVATRLIESTDELLALGTRLKEADRSAPSDQACHRYMFCTYRYHADMKTDPPFPIFE